MKSVKLDTLVRPAVRCHLSDQGAIFSIQSNVQFTMYKEKCTTYIVRFLSKFWKVFLAKSKKYIIVHNNFHIDILLLKKKQFSK